MALDFSCVVLASKGDWKLCRQWSQLQLPRASQACLSHTGPANTSNNTLHEDAEIMCGYLQRTSLRHRKPEGDSGCVCVYVEIPRKRKQTKVNWNYDHVRESFYSVGCIQTCTNRAWTSSRRFAWWSPLTACCSVAVMLRYRVNWGIGSSRSEEPGQGGGSLGSLPGWISQNQ